MTVAELWAQVLILHDKVDQMAAKLKQPPSITGLTVTPASLPAGGGSVAINATVKNATSVLLDGAAVTLPTTVNVTASKSFTLTAHGSKSPDATATVSVIVAPVAPVNPYLALGYTDSADGVVAVGWAGDSNLFPLTINVVIDGAAAAGTTQTNVARPDIPGAYPTLNGFCGWTFPLPQVVGTHSVTGWFTDSLGARIDLEHVRTYTIAGAPPDPGPGPTPTGEAVVVTRDPVTNMDPYNKDMQWYSMFRTNDGRIIIAAGGYHSVDTNDNSVRAYTPATRTWATLRPNTPDPVPPYTGRAWLSTDNKAQWFVPSLGNAGVYLYANNMAFDVGANALLFSDQVAPYASGYIDLGVGDQWLRKLNGFNAATEWCAAMDCGILTTVAESGNTPADFLWCWLEKTGNATKPLRLSGFAPPSLFTDQAFYPDALGNGGWVLSRNFSAIDGEYMYLGGGVVFDAARTSYFFNGVVRTNKRFFRIHLPSLKAATTDAQKNAAVTELAPCPVGTYYPALSFDSKRNKCLLFAAEKIFCYDIATDAWADVTPVAGTAPDYDGWTPFPIPGWMAVYDPTTDAHYVREGSSVIGDPRFADYDHYSMYTHAGRMRKVQLVAAPSGGVTAPSTPAPDVPSTPAPDVPSTPAAGSRYSVVQHGGGQPFNHVDSGLKHGALLYDNVADELIQAGGDYFGQIYMTVPTPSAPTPREYGPYHSGGKRDAWMCKPKADGAVLNWQCVQQMFMPYGQNQGPSGPDQIWWFLRTAGGRHEYYWMPGAWRGFQYEADNNLPVELKGDPYKPFQWLRPGWKPLPARDKMPESRVTDTTKQVGIATNEPDKFCAYDEQTDSAYCINDNFEIVKFSFATMDWSVTRLGRPADIINELSSGGSLQALVGRRIYALGAWFEHVNGPTHSGLCWFDIDAKTRGFIAAPFDVDPLCFVPNVQPPLQFGQRNPEESAGLVALGTKLVVIRTYDVVPQGGKCIWIYDTATGQWTEGEPAPFTLWGRAWCALPYENSVLFFGTADAPYERDPSVFKYRIAA